MKIPVSAIRVIAHSEKFNELISQVVGIVLAADLFGASSEMERLP